MDGATERYSAILGSQQEGHVAALNQPWRLADRGASTMAYADAFRAIMIAFVVATIIMPFARRRSTEGNPARPASFRRQWFNCARERGPIKSIWRPT